MNYNELAKTIHEQNKAVGWWDDPDRCLLTCVQLTNTEVCEATEGFRKDLMDDHLPHRKMEEVELADAVIRALDLGGHLGLTVTEENHEFVISYRLRHAKTNCAMHLWLTEMSCKIGRNIDAERPKQILDENYTDLILSIEYVAKKLGYDLDGAIMEKIEYNKHRQDHKRSERAKEGGKKI